MDVDGDVGRGVGRDVVVDEDVNRDVVVSRDMGRDVFVDGDLMDMWLWVEM